MLCTPFSWLATESELLTESCAAMLAGFAAAESGDAGAGGAFATLLALLGEGCSAAGVELTLTGVMLGADVCWGAAV